MKEQKGMTLIELMLVIGCVGILAAISVPQWLSEGRPYYRLKAAGRQVISDIRLARAKSVATNRQFRLRFDPDSNCYLLEKGDAYAGSVSWDSAGTSRYIGEGGDPAFTGVVIHGTEEYSVTFQPSGGVSPGTVTLQNDMGQTLKIICSMTGRIRLVKE